MNEESRSIDLEVVVPGDPEQVWAAIATGPGISSWYVPTTVEEREGGELRQRFGSSPEDHVVGRVAVWEPGRRVVFDSGDSAGGMAFEWTVQSRDGGSCVVRLVNSGFGEGEEWDAQYDGMAEGWRLFLANLRLHLAHFPGRAGSAMLPMASWPGPREAAWRALTGLLGLPATTAPGERVAAAIADGPSLAGDVAECEPWRLTLLLDEPAPGLGFVAVEGEGEHVTVSVWLYLYGDRATQVVDRDEPRWQRWLAGAGAGARG